MSTKGLIQREIDDAPEEDLDALYELRHMRIRNGG
jgi:hypothetical protein